MDPVANLKEQLELAREIQHQADVRDEDWDMTETAERLADLVLALDEWMRNGGFSPWG